MMGLDVDEAGDLLESAEHIQLVRIHGRIAWTKGEVGIDLLEAIEGGVEDGETALEHGAVPEVLDVAGVDSVRELTDLGTRTITRNTFAFLGPKLLRAGSDTGSVILEQMLWTLADTGGSIGIFSVGVSLPFILGWIVDVHWRTFLFANTVIVEILAGQAIG